jgi:ubiquinol-cytochrome c reductase iron-sulfur subunit
MENTTNKQRRLIMLATGASAVAAGVSLVMHQSRNTNYLNGSPISVELGKLAEGELLALEWQGKPVWVLRRSASAIAGLAANEKDLADPESLASIQPAYCRNRQRSLRPEIFVAIGLCPHQGCSPVLQGSGVFLCPCHTSRFDLAGRVFKAGPATANLSIPAYRFESENRLLLGAEG